jgi:hypothetical protein
MTAPPLVDVVDRIEINHVLNPAGDVLLDQVIYWDFSPHQSRYVVRARRQLRTPALVPYRSGSLYRACWRDARDGNVTRVVTAREVVETWTDFDPETANQEVVDRNFRRELRTVRRAEP